MSTKHVTKNIVQQLEELEIGDIVYFRLPNGESSKPIRVDKIVNHKNDIDPETNEVVESPQFSRCFLKFTSDGLTAKVLEDTVYRVVKRSKDDEKLWKPNRKDGY